MPESISLQQLQEDESCTDHSPEDDVSIDPQSEEDHIRKKDDNRQEHQNPLHPYACVAYL